MSRESKILEAGPWGVQATISHYESFGWELLSLNGEQITMSRETQDDVYTDLIKHQAAYEEKVNEYNATKAPVFPAAPKAPDAPVPFSLGTCAILLLLAILPGALYIAYKVNKKREYAEAMQKHAEAVSAHKEKCAAMTNAYKETRAKIEAEMKAIVEESHAIFFSKRA